MDEIHRGGRGDSFKNVAGTIEGRRCDKTNLRAKIPHRMLHHGPISLREATRRRGGTVEWKVDASVHGMEVGEGGRGACWEGFA